MFAALPRMSQSAMSTAAIAVIVTGPRRQYALVEVLPGVLDAARVAADQQRDDVLLQVARDRQLATVQRRVADPVQPVLGDELQRDEVAARRADDDAGLA